jgi:hypothetical protein
VILLPVKGNILSVIVFSAITAASEIDTFWENVKMEINRIIFKNMNFFIAELICSRSKNNKIN